jgi:diguanylate cyclase (GGDEF)-like protein/PAS domain S-box-containing protein
MWLCILLINLFVVGTVAWVIIHNREREVVQATIRAENYAEILGQSLSGAIKPIDLTLLTAREEIARQMARGGVRTNEIEAFLTQQDRHIPEALGLRVVDAAGVIRYAVNDVKVRNASIADRPQFIRLRDDPAAGLVFSKPIMGRAAQKWMITLGRRLDNPDGSFAGDIHVAVSVNYFMDIFKKVDLGPHGSIGLWDHESVIARYTKADDHGASVGVTTPSPALRRLLTSGQRHATYHTRSGVDGVDRVFHFHQVGDYPLFLIVGLADDDYLAVWKVESLRLAALAAMFLIASLVSTLLINRSWKRRQTDHQLLISQEQTYTCQLESSKQEAEAARRQSELILTSAGEGICGVDRDGKIIFINPAARRMFGWSSDEGEGWNLHALTHARRPDGSDYPNTDCPLHWTVVDGVRREAKDELFWRKDGSSFAVEFTAGAIEEDGRITGAVTVFRDITERKVLEEQIARLALFDTLTGLPNRSYLSGALPRFTAMAQRRQESVGILFMDLDGFKYINDTYGHSAGDQVLREVALRIQSCVRTEDVVARLGGDEFLVLTLSPSESAATFCSALAERLIAAVSQPIAISSGVTEVGTSIGISLFPHLDLNIEQCVQLADAAMYQAKHAGKGRYAVFGIDEASHKQQAESPPLL